MNNKYIITIRESENDRLIAILGHELNARKVIATAKFIVAYGCTFTDEELTLIKLSFSEYDLAAVVEDEYEYGRGQLPILSKRIT